MKCRTSSGQSRRGLTLVEAALGAAILGTLLVALLGGASRFQGQTARAERRLSACRTADRLLESWWAKRETFPRASSGTTPDGWTWRTRIVGNPEGAALKGEVVALEVFAPGQKEAAAAARVEILLPEQPREDGSDAR